MKQPLFVSLMVIILILAAPTLSYGTNEGSWQYGYQQGSLKSPQIASGANWYPGFDNNTCALGGSRILTYPPEKYGTVIPAVTNTTACINGWFSGWKNWCSNHAVDCVDNFPDMMLKAHEQYLAGYNAANSSGVSNGFETRNSMSICPINENAAFCGDGINITTIIEIGSVEMLMIITQDHFPLTS